MAKKTTVSQLNIAITADAKGLRVGISEAGKGFRRLETDATKSFQAISKWARRASLAIASIGIAAVGLGIKLAAELETATVAFEVLLKSASKAKQLIGEIEEFASITPFSTSELIEGARKLLAFEVATDDLVDTLAMLGDVAAGSGQDLNEIVSIFGKVKGAGKLTGETILQFAERGLVFTKALRAVLGDANADIAKLASEGAISFDHLQQAMKLMTDEGGRFFEATKKQSQTLNGVISTLKDNFGRLAREIGTALLPILKSTATAMSDLAKFVRGLSREQVENTAKFVAFTTALSVSLVIIPKVVAAIKTIVVAIRAMAKAQTIAQALGGPRGIATLVAGLAVAAGAVIAVDKAFDELEKSADAANKALADAADTVDPEITVKVDASKLEALRKRLAELRDEAAKFFREQGGSGVGARTQSGRDAVRDAINNRKEQLANAKREAAEQAKRDKERDKILKEIKDIMSRIADKEAVEVDEVGIVG